MNRSKVMADVVSSIGALLTTVEDGNLQASTDFGDFSCSVENFDNFAIIQRDFKTGAEAVSIPFSCDEPSVQMIFSLDGQSFFNDRFDPFTLSPVSHCINFFKYYECQNLMHQNGRQHDITFRLRRGFYSDLIASHLASSEDRLPEMIVHQKEFNTINQHIAADAAVLGILKNILDCPFKGKTKVVFIREHIRALLTLQLFHFSPIVTGKAIQPTGKLGRRDEDILHDIRKHLDEHFLDPASIDSLTKRFGINEFKLKHGFKVCFDTSPMRYLLNKRLEYSLFLLRETDKSIKSIGDEIGYSHAANFTAAFTKTFGKSPADYRVGRREILRVEEREQVVT